MQSRQAVTLVHPCQPQVCIHTTHARSHKLSHGVCAGFMLSHTQVIDLTRQQEVTKQSENKAKEAEFRAQAAAQAKVRGGGTLAAAVYHSLVCLL